MGPMNQETAISGFPDQEDRSSERWFAMWRSNDFSWEGLAETNWEFGTDPRSVMKRWRAPVDYPGDGEVIGDGQHAYKQASLQDYWRWSFGFEALLPDGAEETPVRLTDDQLIAAGLLVEYEGALWHILHRPAASFVDALSDESKGPGLLARALSKRLEASGPDTGGVDNRVQLSGARIKNVDLVMQRAGRAPAGFRSPRLYVRTPLSEFETFAVSGLSFGDTSLFEKCRFVRNCSFSTSKFGDSISFEQSIFGDQTDFYKAQFGANASFDRSEFGTETEFEAVRFGDRTSFRHVLFADYTRFEDAQFGDHTDFRGCKLGTASFNSAQFGAKAEFRKTQFGSFVSFSNARLEGAMFQEAEFGETLQFTSADLSHAHFQIIDLRKTTVHWSGASLVDCEFKEVTYERDLLEDKCRGLKGVASIWGDALLRRDLADQDYIDTLNARQVETRPDWKEKPSAEEELSDRARRLAGNFTRLLNPNVSRSDWIIMAIGAVSAGLLLTFVVNPDFFEWAAERAAGQQTATLDRALALLVPTFGFSLLSACLIVLAKSWAGQRLNFHIWKMLGFGRDWDRVALLALCLIALFGVFYNILAETHITFACESWDAVTRVCTEPAPGSDHWFMPWFVAAMGFTTLGIADVAQPITGLGQLVMIINVLAGFTIFGLLLAVLGNRFARRS